jgi:hypothetical protein
MADVTQSDPLAIYLGAAPNRRQANAETLKAYELDWRAFDAFCAQRGLCSMPALPYSVAGYLAASAQTLQASTVARRLHAIKWGHERAGFPSPTRDAIVCKVMAGVRRLKGTTQERKQPLSRAALRKMFATAPEFADAARSGPAAAPVAILCGIGFDFKT